MKFGHRVFDGSSFLVTSKVTLNRRNSGVRSPRRLQKMTRYFFFLGLAQLSVLFLEGKERRPSITIIMMCSSIGSPSLALLASFLLFLLFFQTAATDEKSCLEEEQRAAARDRKERCYEHIPKYFEQDDNRTGGDKKKIAKEYNFSLKK